MTFESRLREQATKSLDITERVLNGKDEVPEQQRRTALSMISGQLKQQAVSNGKITQIISLTKLGVRDPAVRERIALTALEELLPQSVAINQKITMKVPATLAGELVQRDTAEIIG